MRPILLIVISVVITGCSKKPAATIGVPTGWSQVNSAAGHFKAALPDPWIQRTRTMPSPVSQIADVQFLHEEKGQPLSYSITYADLSDAQIRQLPLDKLIDAGRDEMVKLYKGALELDKQIDTNGRHGRDIVVSVSGRGKFVVRYIVADPRLYTLTLAGFGADFDSKEGKAFFGSFRLIDAKQ